VSDLTRTSQYIGSYILWLWGLTLTFRSASLPYGLAVLSGLAGVLSFFRFSLLVLLSYLLSVCFAREFSTELALASRLTLTGLSVLLSYFLNVRTSLRFVWLLIVCHRNHLHEH
jgi:hypothetical protein